MSEFEATVARLLELMGENSPPDDVAEHQLEEWPMSIIIRDERLLEQFTFLINKIENHLNQKAK